MPLVPEYAAPGLRVQDTWTAGNGTRQLKSRSKPWSTKAHFFIQLSDVIVGLCLSLLIGGMLLNLLLRRRHLIGGSARWK
jgi:hypothetical protein